MSKATLYRIDEAGKIHWLGEYTRLTKRQRIARYLLKVAAIATGAGIGYFLFSLWATIAESWQ